MASAARASSWADLLEIRADYVRDLDLRRLLRDKPGPVLFTLRASHEGGDYSGSERTRLETILEAAQCGADLVDVEFSAFWKPVVEVVAKSRVVLSYHNFEETPEDLRPLIDSMAETGAGILKIATHARCLADNLSIARALRYASEQHVNLCAAAMGREGIPSRILGGHWGSWMIFASVPGGRSTAEGQVPADEMAECFRIRQISAATQLYGVLGKPLGHSLSPRVHNAAFAARGMDAVFLPLEASSVDDFLQFDEAFPIRGASVTIPFKEEICARAHSLSVAANNTRAVNTLVRRAGGWHGENTDVDGFLQPLLRRIHLGKMRAVVLGAGGAARAVVYGLRSYGATVCVLARDVSKARILADEFQTEHGGWEQLPVARWDLLVNATPVGMYPQIEETPVRAEWLTGEWVCDLVYNPGETRLLREAAQRGCRTISGIDMFLAQAKKQQQLWCGSAPPEQVMEDALKSALRPQTSLVV